MDVLPNEILKVIIGFLDKDDLLTVRLLNKTWQIYAEDKLRTKYFSLKMDEDILNLIRKTSWRYSGPILPSPFVRFSIKPEISQKVLVKFSNSYGNRIQGLRFEEKITEMEYLNMMAKLLMTTPNIEEAYFMNRKYCDFFKTDYELKLPKLRFVEFSRMDTDHIKLILNRAPGIQDISFNALDVEGDARFRMKDFITILESIGKKGIEVKMKYGIYGWNKIEMFTMMTKISFRITELTLRIHLLEVNMRDLAPMQVLIQQFIQKHSHELKFLRIECYEGEQALKLTLNHNKMLNLEKLELDCGEYSTPYLRLKVNLGLVPILKEIRIRFADLIFGSIPSLKSLTIKTITIDEYLDKFRLIEDTIQLEKLSLIYPAEVSRIPQASIQQLKNFLITQAKELKELKIKAKYKRAMGVLELPKMIKLKRLKLDMYSEGRVKMILHPLQFPNLEFLNLNASFYQCWPTNVGASMKYVHMLILGLNCISDIRQGGLSFPRLRKLHVPDPDYLFLATNLYVRHIEELYLKKGGTWKDITGISKTKNFSGYKWEYTNGNIRNNTSNLGKLNALKSLVVGEFGEDGLKAVAFLISCGKLPNLKYFETTISEEDKELNSPFLKIIESKKTKTKIHGSTETMWFNKKIICHD